MPGLGKNSMAQNGTWWHMDWDQNSCSVLLRIMHPLLCADDLKALTNPIRCWQVGIGGLNRRCHFLKLDRVPFRPFLQILWSFVGIQPVPDAWHSGKRSPGLLAPEREVLRPHAVNKGAIHLILCVEEATPSTPIWAGSHSI